MENIFFKDMELSKEIQKAIKDMGFEEATPIQTKSIPHILQGKDIIGQAQTGTGKTCAFGIPALELVDPEDELVQVLILCPTRELAIQVTEELKNLSKYKKGIRILPVYGGQQIDWQITALKRKPQIIVGTPGRVMDHMRRKTLKISDLKMIILDEADEMLNMGFREDIDTILEKVPEEKQMLLFSATMPRPIMELTKKYQKSPVHIKDEHKQLTVTNIQQTYIEVGESAKLDALCRCIDANSVKLALVFCNTKRRVDQLADSLQSRGYMVEALHGDMKQVQRDRVMNKFRKSQFDILIATDVAARGIDVDDVEVVFNYDIPANEEYYVHRIGRTGRAGRKGMSITFVHGKELYKLKEIQRYIKATISPQKLPTMMDVEENKVNNVLEKIKEVLADESYSKYTKYIEQMLKEYDNITSIDIAASFLKMMFSDNSNQQEIETFENTGAEQGKVRFFINIGSSNKIQPKHIIESLESNAGISKSSIGVINIFDKYSFVEVSAEHAQRVLKTMKDAKVKGKRINIEKANKK